MRHKKRQGPRDAVLRLKKNTVAGITIKSRPRLRKSSDDDDDYYDDEDIFGGPDVVHITEQKSREPEFSGLLTADAVPIFKFFMPKPGIGFLAEGIEDFDPDAFMYGVHPAYGPVGDDEDEGQTDEEEDGTA